MTRFVAEACADSTTLGEGTYCLNVILYNIEILEP